MKKLRIVLMALVVLPFAVLGAAQDGPAKGGPVPDRARMEKRMRLARTLGLAEALDLDPAQALKLGETLNRFDDRRKAIHKQAADARDVLHRAASDEKATAADVDGAIARLVDSRTQLTALDKETLQAITQGLSPDKKARATLFLARFRERIERRVMFWGGPGGHGPGMMRGPGNHGPRGGGPDDGTQGAAEQAPGGPGAPVDRWAARPGEDEPPFFADDDQN
jgi:hypothetical protein